MSRTASALTGLVGNATDRGHVLRGRIQHVARRDAVDVADLPAAAPLQQDRGDPGLFLQPGIAFLVGPGVAHRVQFPEHAAAASGRQVANVVQRDTGEAARHVCTPGIGDQLSDAGQPRQSALDPARPRGPCPLIVPTAGSLGSAGDSRTDTLTGIPAQELRQRQSRGHPPGGSAGASAKPTRVTPPRTAMTRGRHTAVRQLSEAFGASDVSFVFNGTGANVLGLSLMLRPYEAVICAESAHLNVDECGAPERIRRLQAADRADAGRQADLRADRHPARRARGRAPRAATGGRHHPGHRARHLLHAGGAAAARGVLPGQRTAPVHGRRPPGQRRRLPGLLARRAGCRSRRAEFRRHQERGPGRRGADRDESSLAAEAPFLRKQQMQLASKMRYLAAQFSALLEDELWLRNATKSNAMARRLADALSGVPGVRLDQPVESNGSSRPWTRRSSSRCSANGTSTSGTPVTTWSGG